MSNKAAPQFPFILIVLVALLTVTGMADASEVSVDLSWDHPAERVNGEPLPVEELAGYEIEVRGSNGRSAIIETDVVESAQDVADYPNGDLTLEYRVRSKDQFGLTSAWSDWEVKTTTVKPEAAPQKIQLRLGSGG